MYTIRVYGEVPTGFEYALDLTLLSSNEFPSNRQNCHDYTMFAVEFKEHIIEKVDIMIEDAFDALDWDITFRKDGVYIKPTTNDAYIEKAIVMKEESEVFPAIPKPYVFETPECYF